MPVKTEGLPAGISLYRGRSRTPDKPTYRVRISYKGRQYTCGYYDTFTLAEAALTKFRMQAVLGTFIPLGEQREVWRKQRAEEQAEKDRAKQEELNNLVTVTSYSRHWLNMLSSGAKPRTPSTIVAYSNTLDVHVIPALGDKPLASVDQDIVDKLLALVADRSGPSASRNVARTLRAMYNYAVKEGAAGMTQPPFKVSVEKSKQREDSEIPTPAEVTLISQHMPEATRLAPLLAAVCALRPAETLGLQRRDLKGLDTGRPTLTVSRQWVQKTNPPSYADPKYGSKRTVAIPAFIVPQIKAHLATYVAPDPEAPLFVSVTDPKKPIGGTAYREQWVKAIGAAGTPHFVLHSLRHLGLTLLAVVGATSAEVMARGGHTDPVAAARYQHALRGRDYQLVDALGKEWEGTR